MINRQKVIEVFEWSHQLADAQVGLDAELNHYTLSQRTCGCSPLCAYHSHWKQSLLQRYSRLGDELTRHLSQIERYPAHLSKGHN